MNTATLTIGRPQPWQGRSLTDWLFALAVLAGAGFAYAQYAAHMDSYERGILGGVSLALIALGWTWRPLRLLAACVAAATLLAITLYNQHPGVYGADLGAGDKVFWLKYMLSSQSAIMWMSVLFYMSLAFYWGGIFFAPKAALAAQPAPQGGASRPGDLARLITRSGSESAAEVIGSKLAWGAVFMALTGTFVRWFESHQIGEGIGHIPVSNLYEVFVLFSWLTTLLYLYYEQRFKTRALGAYVMLVVCSAVSFLLWYTLVREAQEIQPLVPALQSWWMKIHVPANFVGYGSFALAAMVAFASLLKTAKTRTLMIGLVAVPFGVVLAIEATRLFAGLPPEAAAGLDAWAGKLAGLAVFFGLCITFRSKLTARLPADTALEDLMYKSIAMGFAFFTIATILGAFWAAEAWGGYWSWDPKETWALIVWLNYAAWLHMRLMKGLRGPASNWWALAGLVVTTFAFLGVNMFLSGLHSYGTL